MNLTWKYHHNPSTTFWVILRTNERANKRWTIEKIALSSDFIGDK